MTMTPKSLTESLPQIIFLDAMGTLFTLHSSVGEIYQKFAFKYGVKVDAKSLNNAFISSFKSASPLAFSSANLVELKQQEFIWWKNVVKITFVQINAFKNFSNFTDFFQEIYTYFATQEPWYIFPEVVPTLQKWQQQGIQLGVISNFDTRLLDVLELLELSDFFNSITISSSAGYAKPNPNIFKIALRKHNAFANQAWHIGDSILEDYEGAKNTGINSFWLNRKTFLPNIENQLPNLSSVG